MDNKVSVTIRETENGLFIVNIQGMSKTVYWVKDYGFTNMAQVLKFLKKVDFATGEVMEPKEEEVPA